MKVHELFEAVQTRFPPWSKKGEFLARIKLGSGSGVKNPMHINSDLLKKTFKASQEKFAKMAEEHPTHFLFKTPEEAINYMKDMELPNWPLAVEFASSRQDKTRSATIEITIQSAEYKDIKISDNGDGWYLIHVDATTGKTLTAIGSIAFWAMHKKMRVKNRKGEEFKTISADANYRPNAILVKGDLKKIEELVNKIIKDHGNFEEKRTKEIAYNKSDEAKKIKNKENAVDQKTRKLELDTKYGKDIVQRVKIKSIASDGDDGYQWSLWVDGVRKQSGMTRYQAQGEQRSYWAYLLKISKMTPEELQKESDIAYGVQAYFMLHYLENHTKQYLDSLNKIAKNSIDVRNKTTDVINKAKDSADPKKQMRDLMTKLRKKI